MKIKVFPLIIFFFVSTNVLSQNQSNKPDVESKNRYGLWIIPSPAKNIYGLTLGLFGNETICNLPYSKSTHGVNAQILGQGFFLIFYFNEFSFKKIMDPYDPSFAEIQDSSLTKSVHNGILVSTFGTFTDQVNGISISSWMSRGRVINGVSLNLLWNCYDRINGCSIGMVNYASEVNGVQIGIINKSKKLRGIQVGLWNRNEKRSFPILNWNLNN